VSQSLGTFIRERRQDLDLTQEALADRIGGSVRQADVSRLENDRIALPRRERLEAIAAALEVSLGELLLRTGWMQKADGLATALPENGSARHDNGEPLSVTHDDLASVADLENLIEDALRALAQAQDALMTVQRALHLLQNPRGEIHSAVGLFESWELSDLFVA
jgi:transcriptional regulator with XRE-family HTH domain